ncbi:rho GTPase-activating protein 20 [Gastrophryne carolinensis]
MSPQQDNGAQQPRSASLSSGDCRTKKMKSLAQRRQSAPSLVISKALNKSRTINKDGCFSPVSPDSCPLVQAFICPSRAFITHSHVQLKTGLQTQDRHLFLFTDILVIAKSKSPSHYKLKQHVRVEEMWTASCMEEVCEGSTYPDRSFVIGWPVTNCVATFSTPEEKEKWLVLLERHIREGKENNHPKIIPLKIITKDIGNCAYSKTLTVTKENTVTDVIRLALQQFGVEGADTDYQLWVTSGKDDAPYPLIGHEFPFSIKMSHIRDALPQIQLGKDSTCPLNLEEPFLMEKLPQEMQCHFILKPSRLAIGQQLTDPGQKPFKRKKSIINWTFWRGSSSHLDNIPLSPSSSTPGKMFGLSLSVICENDNLPKAVMDMLSVLCQDGPFTRGIFRRSANAKACKEMKERLDAGFDVDFTCESVFVTASILKDFLRNIPGSVFSSKLFDKWVSVTDQGNQVERIKAVKKLLEKLPQVNVTLLRYLFGVLYSIEQRSDSNQMTAFNLAVCIAPSLLWLPNSSSPEAEGEYTGKVSVLIQFLIENYCTIFGDDLSLLYGSLSTKDHTEDNSDLCSLKHIDSSYDSLENELNDDGDSPCIHFPTKRSHGNRSRDSVLTLSDCDFDQHCHEESRICGSSKTPPVSTVSCHQSVLHEQSENESLCSNTSGYSSATDVRRHRRCSEPAIGILTSRFSQLNESPHENNSSCDALLSQSADYLKQHRYLQVEGQKLINRSVTLGIDVSKGNGKKINDKKNHTNRLLPPNSLRINLCSRTSCSSLSSPGTSPSGSSLSSLDSAFSQFSDYSLVNSNEVPSNLEFPPRQHTKSADVSADYMAVNSVSGFAIADQSKQPYNSSLIFTGKTRAECTNHKSSANTQTVAWLKNGRLAVKNKSSKKLDKITPEDWWQPEQITTKETSGVKSEISECSFFVEKILVPKSDCETHHQITIERSRVPKEEALKSTRFVDKTSSWKLPPNPPFGERCILDKNGNGESDTDYSSFLFPSPVSINLELSPRSQESTINLELSPRSQESTIDLELSPRSQESTINFELSPHSQESSMPQTFFIGNTIALLGQRNRRKSTNSLILEEPVLLNANLKSSSEHSVHHSEDDTTCSKDDTSRTSVGKDFSFLVSGFKKNKVLPTNVDTGFKISSCDLVKNFCVSPKLNTFAEDFILPSYKHKPDRDTEEGCHIIKPTGQDWHKKCCSDPRFEETDQRLYTEESYV